MILAFWLLLLFCSPVQADLYKQVAADGRVTYTNLPLPGAQRILKDPTAAPVVPVPAKSMSSTKPVSSARRQAAHRSTPSSFPRIEARVQKQRDATRRSILEQELIQEEKLVAAASHNLQEAGRSGSLPGRQQQLKDTLLIHQKNVEALKKELARIR